MKLEMFVAIMATHELRLEIKYLISGYIRGYIVSGLI